MNKMTGHDAEGCLRYDKYSLVWVMTKDGWEKMTNQEGEQLSVTQMFQGGISVIWPFDIGEDPSDEDPRIAARLTQLEEGVKEIRRLIQGLTRLNRDNIQALEQKLDLLIDNYIGR